MQQYYRKKGEPHVFPRTPQLDFRQKKRGDLILCDASGNPIDSEGRPAMIDEVVVDRNKARPKIASEVKPQPMPTIIDGSFQQTAEPETPPAESKPVEEPETPVGPDPHAPTIPVSELVGLNIGKWTKTQCIEFARDVFKMNLDSNDSLPVLRKRVGSQVKKYAPAE